MKCAWGMFARACGQIRRRRTHHIPFVRSSVTCAKANTLKLVLRGASWTGPLPVVLIVWLGTVNLGPQLAAQISRCIVPPGGDRAARALSLSYLPSTESARAVEEYRCNVV